MKRTALLAAGMTAAFMMAAPALAADTTTTTGADTTKTTGDDTSAMPTPVEGVDTVAPLEGANSYTQAQVGEMLAENGFTDVQGLMLDDKGIWRGTATHSAKSGDVAVDYRGNLFFDGKRIIKADEEKPE